MGWLQRGEIVLLLLNLNIIKLLLQKKCPSDLAPDNFPFFSVVAPYTTLILFIFFDRISSPSFLGCCQEFRHDCFANGVYQSLTLSGCHFKNRVPLTNDPQKAATQSKKMGFTLKCTAVSLMVRCCATVMMAPPFQHAKIFGIAAALDAKMQYIPFLNMKRS